jgi:hypothetical protein
MSSTWHNREVSYPQSHKLTPCLTLAATFPTDISISTASTSIIISIAITVITLMIACVFICLINICL